MNVRNLIDDLSRVPNWKVRNKHFIKRFIDRISVMDDDDIRPSEKERIFKNIFTALYTNFDRSKSYAVFLGDITISPESEHYYRTPDGREYYRVNTPDASDILKDSTGNEFWMIIRNNKIHTIFLRKDVQRNYNVTNLRVDQNLFLD